MKLTSTRQPKFDNSFELDTYNELVIPVETNQIKYSPPLKHEPQNSNSKYEFKKEADSLIFMTQPKGNFPCLKI